MLKGLDLLSAEELPWHLLNQAIPLIRRSSER